MVTWICINSSTWKHVARLLGFTILLQLSEGRAYWPRRLLFKLENVFPKKKSLRVVMVRDSLLISVSSSIVNYTVYLLVRKSLKLNNHFIISCEYSNHRFLYMIRVVLLGVSRIWTIVSGVTILKIPLLVEIKSFSNFSYYFWSTLPYSKNTLSATYRHSDQL